METLTNFFSTLGSIAWGPYMLAFIGFTGLYLIIGLKFMPIIKIKLHRIYVFRRFNSDLIALKANDDEIKPTKREYPYR